MQWLQSASPGLTLFLIVIGLAVALVMLFWIFRKIAGSGTYNRNRNRPPRLSVSDHARVDDKRRLVLVRRDNVEHLVMIGGGSDILIEGNIEVQQEPVAASQRLEPTSDQRGEDEPSPTVSDTETRLAGAAIAAGMATAPQEEAQSGEDAAEEAEIGESRFSLPEENTRNIRADSPVATQIADEAPEDDKTSISEAATPEPVAEEARRHARFSDDDVPQKRTGDTGQTPLEIALGKELGEPEPPQDTAKNEFSSEPTPEVTAEEVRPENVRPAQEAAEKKRRMPLSSNAQVEDEMQRLLDELSNN